MRTKTLLVFAAAMYLGCAPKITSGPSSTESASTAADTASQANAAQKITNLKAPRRGEVLFLGNESKHHDANKYAPWLAISLFKSGVNLTYTNTPKDLNDENLAKYDALIIYANHDTISASQESALKTFVAAGKGLVPLHSATGCFRNSDWYINTIGGQFKSHGVGTFSAAITNTSHPVMKDVREFASWDETYFHQRINPDITVLMERVDGAHKEPYTWTRTEGNARIFYTAFGHNDSTWTNAGFMKLVNNGVLWAVGDEVKDQITRLNRPDIEIYTPSIMADFHKRHYVPKMQDALSPEESLKHTQVPVDFEAKLFAAEPNITNPISMSWDERGRLWVVESVDYPNTIFETDGAANDRIKICEDTDGDGMADKFTVFADSLNIPTSMVFANDGVIVAMAPYFLFLKDTNGDDKADVREIVMNGWDKGDTHFGPSNLQYGFDNKIWGVVGSGFNGKTKDGKTLNFRTGVYHLKPDGTDFEFLANTSNNTWGLGLSEDNNVFISTANNTHSAFYSMPAKYTQRALASAGGANENASQILPVQKIDGHYDVHTMTPNLRQVDVVGGFTSAAGHHLYTARQYPKEYWNRVALVCEPTVRLLHKAIIEPDGAGFTEKDGWNLMASSDEWFGPVHAQVGPDGAVWVSDWYNFIIQHNVFVERQAPSEVVLPFKEQPMGKGNAFISPLRDLDHGRIYRVVYKKGNQPRSLKLSKEDVPGLISALSNDNMFWRMHAQRMLVEMKNRAVVPELIKLISNRKVDEVGLNSPAVHALWTLHGIGALDGSDNMALAAVIQALKHPAAGVRKAAVQVLPSTASSLDAIESAGLLKDANLNTRLAAFLSMVEMKASDKAGQLVYDASLAAENGNDQWISKALLAAAIQHEEGFRAAFAKTTAAQPNELRYVDRVMKTLSQELYPLPRRGMLSYSPDVSNKEIIFKGTITKGDRPLRGMIAAQGDKQDGYGLFVDENKLHFVVNKAGKQYRAVSNKALPEKFDVESRLAANGQMTLMVDGKQVAKAKAPAFFTSSLKQGVRASFDYNNDDRIGSYDGNFGLTANLQNASIELKRPAASTTAKKQTSQTQTTKTAAPAIKPVTIVVKVVPNVMKFDKTLITIKAGQKVTLVLENPDVMQHNLVIIKPGTTQKVGLAADNLARDPKGAELQYVPRMPEVLHFTKLVNPGEETSIVFTAPTTPGDYPFICTFPGHWRIMYGMIKVVK